MSNYFNRRVQNTPHPTNLPLTKRMWLDAADQNNFVLNGSDVRTWIRQLDNGITVNQATSVRQPQKGLNNVVWDDLGNHQWLDGGSSYLFADSSHSGISLFFLIQSNQTGAERFIFDFGGYSTRGYGAWYSTTQIGCYTPTDYGGIRTGLYISAGSGWNVFGIIIKFGVSQGLYINNALQYEWPISLAQLTAAEINQSSTAGGISGPVTVGSLSKSDKASSRLFAGTIKEIVIVDEAVSDYEHGWIYKYLNSKKP